MTDFDAKRLFSPNGIPKDEWTDEVKEAVRLVNSHSYSDIAREVLAFGEYRARLTPRYIGLIAIATAFTAAVFVPIILDIPSGNMKLIISAAGAVAALLPMLFSGMLLGKYTYVVTNAHIILYKGYRSKVNRWVSFGEYSSVDLAGQSLRIRSGRMIPRPDEHSPYGKGNEMYNMTLRGLEEFEAEKIYSAVNEALKYQKQKSFGG